VVVPVGCVQAGQGVSGDRFGQLAAQAADRAATRLGRYVYLFPAGHQELGKVLHDG